MTIPPAPDIASRNSRVWLWLALAAAIAAHAWLVARGWHFFGGYEFRQAQTALTAWWMKQEGFRLDYPTPLLGPPWSIPMEFPLYQWLVAKLSNVTGLNVTEAGRWVGILAFYGTIPGAWLALRRCRLPPAQCLVAVLPLLGAPLYLFYAREVLIETTALLGGMWFLACLLGYLQEGGARWLWGTWLAGAVAALVKVTTWCGFLTPVALFVLAMIWNTERDRRWAEARLLALRLGVTLIPLFALAFWWVWQADAIKARNANAAFLLSSNLTSFNFGELRLRFEPEFWRVMYVRSTQQLVPAWCGAGLLVAMILVRPRWRWLALGALASYVAVPLVFANLYHVHEYYTCANGAFLCLVAGVLMAGLLDRGSWRGAAGLALLVAVLTLQLRTYYREDLPRQMVEHPADTGITRAIRELSGPEDIFVAVGNDWHASLALQTERRAWMIPNWMADRDPGIMAPGVAQLGGRRVAFALFMWSRRESWDWIDACIANFGLNPVPLFVAEDGHMVAYAAADQYDEYLYSLEEKAYDGVKVVGRSSGEDYAQAQPLTAADFTDIADHFSPVPYRGLLPFGLNRVMHEGTPQLVAPPALYFKRPAGAKKLEITFGMAEEVLDKPAIDGVQFRVEYHYADARIRVLFHQWLQPQLRQSDRTSRTVTIDLPSDGDGDVVLRGLHGPAGNPVFDWGMWQRVRIY